MNTENPPNLPSYTKPANSGLAITSMVLGICGLVTMCVCIGPLFAIPAIACGAIALNQISKSNGAIGGRDQAIAGLITGILSLVLIPFAAIMLLPALQKAKGAAMLSNCTGNIKQIEMACMMYANNNQEQLPPDLEALQKNGFIPPESDILKCPMHNAQRPFPGPSYLYFGKGFKTSDVDSKTILITESDRFHGKRYLVIGFGDGHVEVVHVDPASDLPSVARERGWKIATPSKE